MVTELYPTSELSTHCSFVLGRSCVIPLKVVSIPCLELAAAELNCLIRNELEHPIHDTIYWTDSTIVFQYICNESRRFHMFVANRVVMIQSKWRHVDTCANPADFLSSGTKGSKLYSFTAQFLWKEEENWAKQPSQLPEMPKTIDSECRKRDRLWLNVGTVR